MIGFALAKDEDEVLRGILFTEQDILSPEASFSRLISYYMLGGHNSTHFCDIMYHMLELFSLHEFEFRPDAKQMRYFSIVLGMKVEVGQRISVDKISWIRAPYVLTLKMKLFDL